VTQPPPDKFPNPLQSAVGGIERATAPGVGGIRTPSEHEMASVLGQHRRSPDVDQRASAKLARQIDAAKPRLLRLEGSGVQVATNTLVISLGGPKPGFVWSIRRINVGPVGYDTGDYPTISAVIGIVAGQESGLGVVASASQVFSQTTAYPAEGTWGRDELVLAAGDYLQILVIGLTPTGSTSTAAASGEETHVGVTETYAI
jgi:hypothetical protein